MGTRPTFLQTPTVEIDQDRYEELIKNELKYQIYKKNSAPYLVKIVERETDNLLGNKTDNIEKESEDL